MNLNGHESSKPIFSDYFQEQQQGREVKRKQTPAKEPPSHAIIKEGMWSQTERELIIETIKKASQFYESDLDEQLNFIHFQLEDKLGKRIQILIFKNSIEGHFLLAVDSKFIEIQHLNCIYIIWKVTLIEDLPLEQEY